MAGTRRKCTHEFKCSTIKLVTEQRYKMSEAARNLDINVSLIRRWKAGSEAVRQGDDSSVDLRVELSSTEKKNNRLKIEREILRRPTRYP